MLPWNKISEWKNKAGNLS